ncbi:MAG: hypothetical protein Q4C53_02680 [Clostridia bacterium]|nr:hypothetical protein [Clostridia bacterium]
MEDTNLRLTVTLTREQMRGIARLEILFRDLFPEVFQGTVSLECPDTYPITLDDMTAALENALEKDLTVGAFVASWLFTLQGLSEAFLLQKALGFDGADAPGEYAALPITESSQCRKIWLTLNGILPGHDADEPLTDAVNVAALIDSVAEYRKNLKKPVFFMHFSQGEKECYVETFSADTVVRKATDNELSLCRKFIGELGDDNVTALEVKGYACYGGNRLYECDWDESRRCMEKLWQLTDDAKYANTLGYLAYYGRCNGGVPDYENAFRWFSVSAANGLSEGMYKLGDMYKNGYACDKSPRTAYTLYQSVYAEDLSAFLSGEPNTLADSALRMGRLCAEGSLTDRDPVAAYRYYLQAELAIRIRSEQSDFFGNTAVANNIKKATEEILPELPESFFDDDGEMLIPEFFLSKLIAGNSRCKLTRRLCNGRQTITAERIPTRGCPDPAYVLITAGPLRYCARTRSLTFEVLRPEELHFEGGADSVLFDHCEPNPALERYEFYYGDELTAWIECEGYRLLPGGAADKSRRCAKVRFLPNGPECTCLCDIDADIGDTVSVKTAGGTREGLVTEVFTEDADPAGETAPELPVVTEKK